MNRLRAWLICHTGVVVLTWGAAVGAGCLILLDYKSTPGMEGRIAEDWPAETAIERVAGMPQLVLFAHPKCPCTHASLLELAHVMTACQGEVAGHVRFVLPDDAPDDWSSTPLWRQAASLPGLDVAADRGGREQRRFGVQTSGHVLVYDGGGRLLFSGGITDARGHAGDNAGRDAIVEWLHGRETERTRTPIFGCALERRARHP